MPLTRPQQRPVRPRDGRRWLGLMCAGAACLLAGGNPAAAVTVDRYVVTEKTDGAFALAEAGRPAPIYVDPADYPGVLRIAKNLQADVAAVTGAKPALNLEGLDGAADKRAEKQIVVVGTVGKSPLIDRLVLDGKLDHAEASDLAKRWDAFVIQTVEAPLPGVDRALVIAGSNKRGTIYGMYDLSAQIGVSPWNWWADVPAQRRASLYVLPGRHASGEPAVKYRGIFINDEAPALSGWVQEHYGDFNAKFYERVFDLILRLKGNYLWPAMWGHAIYDDDPASPKLANELGIVIGASHHEPMMRAHVEWQRHGDGPWNYESNEQRLKEFWREGVQRMGANESIVSIGMRGDGDEPMSETANIALLERIIADQREIIAETTGQNPVNIPQMWALYKEVQEYYDKGMRVPDDVTLLLCDDNWGNIRKLPKLDDARRQGGYGIYYHFDYVGDPRNYKWLNTNQIARVWEQMHLAHEYGVDRLWIVNVGDIKPMEFPTEFFLDYAWNPAQWPAEKLPEYARRWAAEQFGEEHAGAIAEILAAYTRYNSRRKPELLEPETYSLTNYREAETVVADYNQLAEQAEQLGNSLPKEYQDAYFQLVLHPVMACANLNELYVTAGRNRLYTKQRRSATNDLANRVRALFDEDAAISRRYHQDVAGGKWNHMMDQTHIGYDNWQEPRQNNMPAVQEIEVPAAAEMGVAVEGSEGAWPSDGGEPASLALSPRQSGDRYLEVFNRGQAPFDYTIETAEPWLHVEPAKGAVEKEVRLTVSIDWSQAPAGVHRAPLTVVGPNGSHVEVTAVIDNAQPASGRPVGYLEADGYVSIEAEHFARQVPTEKIEWLRIPDFGRTLSGVTVTPVTAPVQTPGGAAPRLEYDIYLAHAGDVEVRAYLSPTLNFHNTEGRRYGVSIDDEPPQTVNMHADKAHPAWQQSVRDNVNLSTSKHVVKSPGQHVLKFWMVDPGVVLQKLVVTTSDIPASYLGPPESKRADRPAAAGVSQTTVPARRIADRTTQEK